MTLQSVRRVLAMVLVLNSCAAPTTTPSTWLRLQPGRQLLTITGFDISHDPAYMPTCDNLGRPRNGKNVTTFVDLSEERGEWVARSTQQSRGSIELRIRTEEFSIPIKLVGSIQGTAGDQSDRVHTANGVSVSIAGSNGSPSAQLDGTSNAIASHLNGRMSGRFVFTDETGGGGSCPAVAWTLQPYNE